MLDIITLGRVDLRIDGAEQSSRKDVRRALLLAYLAASARPVPRAELAAMLWPPVDEEPARSNLRTLLYRLRGDGFEPYLQIEHTTVGLNPDAAVVFDVDRLRAHIGVPEGAARVDLEAAASLWHGRFFAAEALADFPEFAAWADEINHDLDLLMIRVFYRLTTLRLAAQEPGAAVEAATHLIDLAPHDDRAQALYLQALAADGQVARAARRLDAYMRTMAKEQPDAAPGPELLAVAAQLARPDAAAQAALGEAAASADAPPPDPDDAPRSSDAVAAALENVAPGIIGRRTEAARLALLLDQGARLISVIGLGGIGKTTFVRSQLPTLHTRFRGRVFFLDFRGVDQRGRAASDRALLTAAASALHVKQQGNISLLEHVQAALGAAPVCLIMDNFESVLDAALTAVQLLEQVPTLTVVTTSRRALLMKGEVLVELGGLQVAQLPAPHPRRDGQDDVSVGHSWSEGAQLFLHQLARQRTGVHADQMDRHAVEDLCARLGGHPLAIELAAAQADFSGLDELLAAATEDVDLLAAGRHAAADDHNNLALLLDRMWMRLSPAAQTVLVQLTVFAGAFHRSVMHVVAPASAAVYRELRLASLLQGERDFGWFSLHPLVKQHAAGRTALAEVEVGLHRAACARHVQYYLGCFALGSRLHGRLQILSSLQYEQLTRCQADVFAAWRWAIAHAAWDLLADAAVDMAGYLETRWQLADGVALFSDLYDSLPPFAARTREEQRLAGIAAVSVGDFTFRTTAAAAWDWYTRGIAALSAAGAGYEEAVAQFALVKFSAQLRLPPDETVAALERAAVLVDEHGLDDLRPLITAARAERFQAAGQWQSLRAALPTLMADQVAQNQGGWLSSMLDYAVTLDEWQVLEELIADASTRLPGGTNAGTVHPLLRLYLEMYRSYLLAHNGDLDSAIAVFESSFVTYAEIVDVVAAALRGGLAHLQLSAGAVDAAEESARAALAAARRPLDGPGIVEEVLHVGAYHWRRGDNDKAAPLVRAALARAKLSHWTKLIFSSLYYLAQIYADDLPVELVDRITKIGAVSPAMHFALRPSARDYMRACGLTIDAAEYVSLWSTDRDAVLALVDEVEKTIGEAKEARE